MKKYKYVIVSPPGNAGGIIALHALCHYLSEQGENAKMFYLDRGFYSKHSRLVWLYSWLYSVKDWLKIKLHKKTNMNMLGCSRKWLPIVDKNTVVIYPEIFYGDFLNSKKVVRWLLYHNRFFAQDGEKTIGYGKRDLFFCFRDVFNDEKLNPQKRTLHMTYFDLDTYKKYNYGERKGKCYIVRKGWERSDLPETYDGPVIDYLSEEAKVRHFNECEYCISYDTQTAYSQIAALCGCISVVMPEAGKTKADYREKEELTYGVAFGMMEDEIQHAKDTAPLVELMYKKSIDENVENAAYFISECEAYFGANQS